MPLWNPSSSANNLKCWIRGNGQRTVSGTDIIALYDESGSGNDIDQVASSPDTKPQTGRFINDIPAWDFTPVDITNGAGLWSATDADILEADDHDLQLTIVFKRDAVSANQTIIAEHAFGNSLSIMGRTSDFRIPVDTSGNLDFGSTTTSAAFIHLQFDDSAETLTAFLNGDSGTSDTGVADLRKGSTNRQFGIGIEGNASGSGRTRPFDGLIAELFVYHGVAAGGGAAEQPISFEREISEGYVAHKYNITISTASHTYKNGPPTACHCVAKQTLSTTLLSASVKNPADLQQVLNVFDERR